MSEKSTLSILFTTIDWQKGPQPDGTIDLVNGKLRVKPTKGNKRVLDEVMRTDVYDSAGKKIDPKKNPRQWLEALPKKYGGGVFFASINDSGKKARG